MSTARFKKIKSHKHARKRLLWLIKWLLILAVHVKLDFDSRNLSTLFKCICLRQAPAVDESYLHPRAQHQLPDCTRQGEEGAVHVRESPSHREPASWDSERHH